MSDIIFTLDEARARTWLAEVLAEGDDQWGTPEIGESWDPRGSSDDSQETYQLCYAAQQTGVITCADGYELAYIEEYDSTYYWSARTPSGADGITVVTMPAECRRLGEPELRGPDQAMAILREGVSQANALLAAFAQFVSPAPAPGGHWMEHPALPVTDWQYEVASGDTRSSYAEWVRAKADDQPCPCGVSHTIAEHNYTPDAEKDTDDRYWSMTLDPENIDDLNTWITQGKLVGIVDEQEGGIIAYVHDDASAQILTSLRQQS